MNILKNKTLMVALAFLLILSMTTSMAIAQVYFPKGYSIPTYAFINVAPNPIGVGQVATVNFFLATPMETGERPTNMTVKQTNPDGTTKILGPFTGDTTGGTFTTFTPDKVGNYTFQFFYGGQTLSGTGRWSGLVNQPSESKPVTLVVQEEPIKEYGWSTIPLPTEWWQTPVSSMNVENWYKIMGPWLGYGSVSFGATGSYNVSGFCNPYTPSVNTGHVIWTKQWGAGGVAGGDAGGTQSSHYWSTRQYQPQYAPVIMNGIMYSTYYPSTTSASNGIVATDLFTGETLWKLNTTNALRCGMNTRFDVINQYGVVGPYIWTTGTLPAADTGGTLVANTGTQWNMYDATTGQYILSVVNGTALTLRTDEMGHMIGYFINNTAGTEMTHPLPGQNVPVTNTGPHLTCVNMTMAIGQTGQQWNARPNTVRAMANGVMWSKPIPTNISGTAINPQLALSSITGNELVLTGGFIHGQGVGGETAGWLVLAGMDMNTGNILMTKNLTYAGGANSLLPFTRTSFTYGDGMFFIMNDVNFAVEAFKVSTGEKVWSNTLKGDNGAPPNDYDLFSLKPYVGNGNLFVAALGGDIWSFETKTGVQKWYTNTTKLLGDPGLESPYGIWPFWVFNCAGQTNDVSYWPIGHEYNPPLFHGAQMIALNNTNGELVFSTLGTYIRSTAIAYGIMLSFNAYDNQIYAFGKGPTRITVDAPTVGVTTATPITITGTITDVAAGANQNMVSARFPNGLPCVSDESMSKWMEYIYQQQPMPTDVKGVEITINVVDSNGNYRTVGTTTSNAFGSYAFTWTPDIAGDYTIMAKFAGSESYYQATAATALYASEAQPAATQMPTTAPSMADLYFLPAIAVVAILIVIVLALLVLMMMKKP
ncbi:PQQ-binding-like beta-propeller repeat protein [Candidatus Bathyarchaeota archaeon]|nr:PQQ-binding-like beta-propeller repeat protein [Candidatus Bathyarchaeota archaeon]